MNMGSLTELDRLAASSDALHRDATRPDTPSGVVPPYTSRSLRIGDAVMTAIGVGRAALRRAWLRYRRAREARLAYDDLRHLDDRMLRDLGFDRSEITSVAAEHAGAAEPTRVRAVLASHVFL